MAALILAGPLNLSGTLNLKGENSGTVAIRNGPPGTELDVLVEDAQLSQSQGHGKAPPVMLPSPSAPANEGPTVWVVKSLNPTITANGKAIVAQGMVLQGKTPPTWPGMVLPSQNNTTPVTAGGLPINVETDTASIFASGGIATLTNSGQSPGG
jgi:hypothetical protein